jgi:hypothetical protein
MEDLPPVFTPEQVAKHFGWSPRKLREFARGLGACRVLGNRMVLTQKDVDAILEATKPAPKPDPTSDYQELLRLRATPYGKDTAKALKLLEKIELRKRAAKAKGR